MTVKYKVINKSNNVCIIYPIPPIRHGLHLRESFQQIYFTLRLFVPMSVILDDLDSNFFVGHHLPVQSVNHLPKRSLSKQWR